MNLRNTKPIVRLEGRIVRRFGLQRKGRKLLGVGCSLSLATIGISLVQAAALLVCEAPFDLWWRAAIVWLPFLVWAWVRYFFRYLPPNAFLCERCDRLKRPKDEALDQVTHIGSCRQCEDRRKDISRHLAQAKRSLGEIREGIALVRGKGRYP